MSAGKLNVKIVTVDSSVTNSAGRVRVSFVLNSHRPLREGQDYLTRENTFVRNPQGQPIMPQLEDNQKQQSLFVQSNNFFSTFVDPQVAPALKPGDTCEFQVQDIWATNPAGTTNVYQNATGSFILNANQMHRMLWSGDQTKTKPTTAQQVIEFGNQNATQQIAKALSEGPLGKDPELSF